MAQARRANPNWDTGILGPRRVVDMSISLVMLVGLVWPWEEEEGKKRETDILHQGDRNIILAIVPETGFPEDLLHRCETRIPL